MSDEGGAVVDAGPVDLDSFDTSYTEREPVSETAETEPPEEAPSADPKTHTVEAAARKAKAESDAAEAEEPAEPAEAPKVETRKIKVNGAEEEVSLEDLERFYQRNKGLPQTVTKKDLELRQQAESYQRFVKTLRENPDAVWDLAAKLGHDPVVLAEARLRREIEMSKLTPEQRQQQAVAEENARIRQQWEAQQRQQEAERQQAEVRSIQQQMVADWSRELQAQGLPADAQTINTAAILAQQIADRDGEIMPHHAAEIAKLVSDFYGRSANIPVEKLVEKRGKELEEFYRKRFGAKEPAPRVAPGRDKSGRYTPRQEGGGPPPTVEEVMEKFGGWDSMG